MRPMGILNSYVGRRFQLVVKANEWSFCSMLFGSQHGLRDESVLSYMCQTDQCFHFGIRRRRIIQTTDVEAEALSSNNCKYDIICI